MNVIGYAGIFSLELILCLIFFLVLLIDIKRIRALTDREQRKLDILCELIMLDRQIRLNNMPKNAYLSQIDSLLENDPFGINHKEIVVCKPRKHNELNQKIYKSYKKASANVKVSMEKLSEILGKIYELNHPFKFKFLELKKNIKLHFLLFFLKLCCFLIEYLEKRDEEKNKNRIKNLKKKQKKVEKYPKSMFLNGQPQLPLAEAG